MRRTTGLVLFGGCLAIAAGTAAACFDDPRANETVTVISACDRSKLSTDPKNPQSTLLAYLQSVDLLVQVATNAQNDMATACNAIGSELGLPAGGDVNAACKPITARADGANTGLEMGPAGRPSPGSPAWVQIVYPPTCTVKESDLAQCVAACSGSCDATKCDPSQQIGTCSGTCNGTCTTNGMNIPCNGDCVGQIGIMGPPTTCKGECTGVCTGVPWAGECAGGCAGFFTGFCAGTCTGMCNGQPINIPDGGGPPMDGGMDGGDAGDAGDDAGMMMGGPPPLTAPPGNADGNCQGFCLGVCSKGASGWCANAPCLDFPADGGAPGLAPFTGGDCATFAGTCAGLCTAAGGSGATSTCNGTCTATKPQCDGTCTGGCSVPLTNPTCTGVLNCGQNTECENACEATALLKATCVQPAFAEVYAITDPQLSAAFKKHATELGKSSGQLTNLRNSLGYIGNRAYGDFVAIGLQGDLVRACVTEAEGKINTAQGIVTTLISVDPSTRKAQ